MHHKLKAFFLYLIRYFDQPFLAVEFFTSVMQRRLLSRMNRHIPVRCIVNLNPQNGDVIDKGIAQFFHNITGLMRLFCLQKYQHITQ